MDFGDEPGAGSGLALKLATDDWEVNVYAPPDEFFRLCDIRAAAWNDRRSIEAGKSAGTRCFWAAVNDRAAFMIGADDETWDISIAIPFDLIDEILAEVGRGTT
jgi:hypothetical protein